MKKEALTQYEKDAVLRALERALETKQIPPEDRAMVVRAKAKLSDIEVKTRFQAPVGRPA